MIIINIENVYKQATGVDIKEQKQLWDDRGKGYFGEFLVFNKLYQWVNEPCKFLMNIEVPTKNGKTTEIDLLMIHPTGIYVFEMKHYKGIIYGDKDGEIWTQWFKTQKSNTFRNPVKQNEYHIKALKEYLGNIPIYSFIVFTNEEDCTLKVEYAHDDYLDVCTFSDLNMFLMKKFNNKSIWPTTGIEKLFEKLVMCAPNMQKQVLVDGDVVPLHTYINEIALQYQTSQKKLKNEYLEKSENLKNEYLKKTKSFKNKTLKIYGVGCLIFFVLLVGSYGSFKRNLENNLENYKLELQKKEAALKTKEIGYNIFLQKFEYVEPIEIGDFIFTQELVEVSNIVLEDSKILEDTVEFSCELFSKNVKKLVILENSAITVILKDGIVKEWGIWNDKYPFHNNVVISTQKSIFGSNKIALHELNGISMDDIDYMKITNVGVSEDGGKTLLVDNFEIEVYKN